MFTRNTQILYFHWLNRIKFWSYPVSVLIKIPSQICWTPNGYQLYSKCLLLYSTEETKSYSFGMTWGWVNEIYFIDLFYIYFIDWMKYSFKKSSFWSYIVLFYFFILTAFMSKWWQTFHFWANSPFKTFFFIFFYAFMIKWLIFIFGWIFPFIPKIVNISGLSTCIHE